MKKKNKITKKVLKIKILTQENFKEKYYFNLVVPN